MTAMPKAILSTATCVVGALLMVLAFVQWITFDYPDANPFWPGAILAPGMLSQILNWGLVCLLGASGWGCWTFGKSLSRP